MTEKEEAGPPDPQLHPARSPGVGTEEAAEVTVSREDVHIGDADPAELTAGDTEPVEDDGVPAVCTDLVAGDPTERKRAAIELGRRESSPTVIDALATAATEDDDADVRQFAVEALGDHGGDTAIELALDSLDDPDPWVRAEAVVALDHTNREAHRERIVDCLDDDHHAVRRNALITLWKRGDPDTFEATLDLADDDSDRVREWVAIILGNLDAERGRSHLEGLTGDESDVVARAAREALGEDGSADGSSASGPVPEHERFEQPPDL